MIERYTPKEMGQHWSDGSKYRTWLEVSLAILDAKARHGHPDGRGFAVIKQAARVNEERVKYWDEGPGGMHHDMQAFTEAVKESLRAAGLEESTVASFNKDVTSYDIEDSALSLRLVKAVGLIRPLIGDLRQALLRRAAQHKDTLMMGLTHGQAAEVITLALKLLNFVDDLEGSEECLVRAAEGVRFGRLAGAVGNYGHLGSDMERTVCGILGLKQPKISTQILHRDRHANLMDALATLAVNMGHIAHNFKRMCDFPRLEAREPFGKRQRGSTQMPHKKNTITLERVRGMAMKVVTLQQAMKLAVITDDERSIDQSCIERIDWPDAFCLVMYMLERLIRLVEDMEFYPAQMRANIDRTLGQLGSGYAKDLLLGKGITQMEYDGEILQTYNWVQSCAAEAWEDQVELRVVLEQRGILRYVGKRELRACFDLKRGLQHLPEIYARFGI